MKTITRDDIQDLDICYSERKLERYFPEDELVVNLDLLPRLLKMPGDDICHVLAQLLRPPHQLEWAKAAYLRIPVYLTIAQQFYPYYRTNQASLDADLHNLEVGAPKNYDLYHAAGYIAKVVQNAAHAAKLRVAEKKISYSHALTLLMSQESQE